MLSNITKSKREDWNPSVVGRKTSLTMVELFLEFCDRILLDRDLENKWLINIEIHK